MRSIVLFFTLSFAIAWILWSVARALVLQANAPTSGPIGELLFLPGTFAPAFAALLLTVRSEGRPGVARLLRRLFDWRVPVRWYVFAVVYVAAIDLAVALVHRVLYGGWPRFGQEPWFVIAGAILVSTVFQTGEEIGWRGYALPRMGRRIRLGSASLVLGLLWAAFHLPLFFIPGVDKHEQSFVVYTLGVTAISVAFAWLYAHTRGSLLLAMLMHSSVNQTLNIVPSVVPEAGEAVALGATRVAWITVAVAWIPAIVFLLRMPRGKWPALELEPEAVEARLTAG